MKKQDLVNMFEGKPMTENKNPQPRFRFGDKVRSRYTTFIVEEMKRIGTAFYYNAGDLQLHMDWIPESELTLVVEPLSVEFECEWKEQEVHDAHGRWLIVYPHDPKAHIKMFIGKRTKVTITELTDKGE